MKIFDKVWVMEYNKPIEMFIAGIIERIEVVYNDKDREYIKSGSSYIIYELITERCLNEKNVGGETAIVNDSREFNSDLVFSTKKELIESLY